VAAELPSTWSWLTPAALVRFFFFPSVACVFFLLPAWRTPSPSTSGPRWWSPPVAPLAVRAASSGSTRTRDTPRRGDRVWRGSASGSPHPGAGVWSDEDAPCLAAGAHPTWPPTPAASGGAPLRAPAAATGDGRPRVVPRLGCRLPPRGEAAAAEAAAVAAGPPRHVRVCSGRGDARGARAPPEVQEGTQTWGRPCIRTTGGGGGDGGSPHAALFDRTRAARVARPIVSSANNRSGDLPRGDCSSKWRCAVRRSPNQPGTRRCRGARCRAAIRGKSGRHPPPILREWRGPRLVGKGVIPVWDARCPPPPVSRRP